MELPVVYGLFVELIECLNGDGGLMLRLMFHSVLPSHVEAPFSPPWRELDRKTLGLTHRDLALLSSLEEAFLRVRRD